MNILKFCLGVLAALVFALNAQALTVKGATSCGNWIKEVDASREKRPDAISAFWMLGYLSGLATHSEQDVMKDIDSASIYGWVTNYCRANPLDHMSTAGLKLFDELVMRKNR